MILTSPPTSTSAEESPYEYVIVGSGGGGAPLAARLAEYGHSVLVLEAGPDHVGTAAATDPVREVTSCPALHAPSTEREEVSWRFFVDHYAKPEVPDPKWYGPGNGIFYPRATGIGGCTIHNAMITIVGPAADWDALAWFLDDPSWNADVMRGYFRKLERCEYHKRWGRPRTWVERFTDTVRWLFGRDVDPTVGRHGFDGWLHTSTVDLQLGLGDPQLLKMLKAAVVTSIEDGVDHPVQFLTGLLRGRVTEALDPNHFRRQNEHPEGVSLIPTAIVGLDPSNPPEQRGRRSSPTPRLYTVAQDRRYRLDVAPDCLATRVILTADGASGRRATGVEYLHGSCLYQANSNPAASRGEPKAIHAKREVILCGGSFNTPQLLMLSGIGPADQLAAHNVPVVVDSPGVGRNLQDRYEVTVVSQMRQPFDLLKGATFKVPEPQAKPDPKLQSWRDTGVGLYASNGAVVGVLKRSRPDLDQPDLFIFGIPLKFFGYEVGYSVVSPDELDRFTWAILKGHTQNHGGTVQLASADPTARPKVNFNYFGTDEDPPRQNDPDLDALVDGVKFVRRIAEAAGQVVSLEVHPAKDMGIGENATDDQIKRWIRQVAWGHHACGTCRMGRPTDARAVTDSRFRVLGPPDPGGAARRPVAGLRVVDASIFPTIPGYFIVSNLYMASEKAADLIHADA